MENIFDVARYIATRYKKEYGAAIDEMKLHKLMYFAQRESYVMFDEPLFEGVFYGWKFGPILKEIRVLYRNNDLCFEKETTSDFVKLMNVVFKRYAAKDSWSLSRLTHGELSWKNSRIGVSEYANSDNPISEDDIIQDAARIKARIKAFS